MVTSSDALATGKRRPLDKEVREEALEPGALLDS